MVIMKFKDKLKRCCSSCDSSFDCYGECGIDIKVKQVGACFCPNCAKEHKITKEGQRDHCETRFGANATSLIPFTKVKVLFT